MGEPLTTKVWETAAIVRLCSRCRKYKSINDFEELGRLCRACTVVNSGGYYGGRFKGVVRGLVVTDKGHKALEEMRSIA